MYNDREIVFDVLRIINNNRLCSRDLRKRFCSIEKGIIINLYKDESIINTFDIESGTEIVSITRKGKFMLFNEDNKEAIIKFGKELEDKGYNTCYLGDYLKTSDLDKNIDEILNISDYDLFVHNIEQLQNSRVTRRILLRNRNIG